MSDIKCWCELCDVAKNGTHTFMHVCPECGDKRCAKARDHSNCCTNKFGQFAQTKIDKPPIGLMPEAVWNWNERRNRMIDIMQAILRYSEAGKPVPVAWCEELLRRIEEYLPPGGKP